MNNIKGRITFNEDRTITLETNEEIIKFKFASFGIRILARILDIILIIPIIFGWFYDAFFISGKNQSTIGQKVFKIKILSIDGNKIHFNKAFIRSVYNIFNLLSFGLGFLMSLFNNKKQCLHDYLSGCIVVKEIERMPKIELNK